MLAALLLASVLHVSSAHGLHSSEVVCGSGTTPVLDSIGVVECVSDLDGGGFGSQVLSTDFGGFNNFGSFGSFGGFGGRGFGFRGLGGFGHHHDTPCTPVAPATSCVS